MNFLENGEISWFWSKMAQKSTPILAWKKITSLYFKQVKRSFVNWATTFKMLMLSVGSPNWDAFFSWKLKIEKYGTFWFSSIFKIHDRLMHKGGKILLSHDWLQNQLRKRSSFWLLYLFDSQEEKDDMFQTYFKSKKNFTHDFLIRFQF